MLIRPSDYYCMSFTTPTVSIGSPWEAVQDFNRQYYHNMSTQTINLQKFLQKFKQYNYLPCFIKKSRKNWLK